MDRTKYIIFDWGTMGEVPILFPSHIGHDEIIRMVQAVYPGINPISAGFVSSEQECYGYSHSTGLKSNPDDSKWIKSMFKKEY